MAANPPDPKWPGGAHVAVQFVVNYEEGGENCDPAWRRGLGGLPVRGRRRRALARQRHWNMESIYEYGCRAGFWRLHRMFTAARHPGHRLRRRDRADARSRTRSRRCRRPAGKSPRHGLKWIDYRDYSPEDDERATWPRRSACTPRSPASARAAGTPAAPPINTVRLVAEEGGFALCLRHLCRRSAVLADHDGTQRIRRS